MVMAQDGWDRDTVWRQGHDMKTRAHTTEEPATETNAARPRRFPPTAGLSRLALRGFLRRWEGACTAFIARVARGECPHGDVMGMEASGATVTD